MKEISRIIKFIASITGPRLVMTSELIIMISIQNHDLSIIILLSVSSGIVW